jgi:hypothetical protein
MHPMLRVFKLLREVDGSRDTACRVFTFRGDTEALNLCMILWAAEAEIEERKAA